jgi:hypothetical protein
VIISIDLLNTLSGTFVLSANNPVADANVRIRAGKSDGSIISDLTLSTVNAVSAAFTSAEVRQATIRVASGAALTNFTLKPQMELGSAATAFEGYAPVDTTLTPSATLYGLTGYEDEIGNDGHETHKTSMSVCRGTSGFSHVSSAQLTNTALFVCTFTNSGSLYTQSICSHLIRNVNGWNTDSECHYIYAGAVRIRVFKSRLSGWSDSLTDAQKAALFNAWLEAQNSAGSPVQVVYQLETATTSTGTATAITGANGANTVTNDGTSVVVTYTGTGWAALGAVERVAVESVSITPEQGLRVDTVLTNGSTSVPTYFNARGSKYGLFRTSDGMLILGGMVLPNGQPAGVAGALVSQGATGETRVEIETASEGSGQARVDTAALHLVQPSFAGATDLSPAATGEKVPVWFEAVRTTLLDGNARYVDSFSGAIKALDSMRLVALGDSGEELAWLLIEYTSEGGLVHTGGAFSASDSERTLANFAPRIHMSAPTSESIVYNATARRYMLDWKTIEDDYARFQTFKGGSGSARDVGIVIQQSGAYRFVFHMDLESSTSSGVMLHVNRMPSSWTPPTDRDYCLDTDLTTRVAYRRAASAPLSASVTTCTLVADLWCEEGDKVLPVVAMAAASKTLVSAGTFFTAQKTG